jgi:hypothetical protein
VAQTTGRDRRQAACGNLIQEVENRVGRRVQDTRGEIRAVDETRKGSTTEGESSTIHEQDGSARTTVAIATVLPTLPWLRGDWGNGGALVAHA